MLTYAKAFVGAIIAALSTALSTLQIGQGFGWKAWITVILTGLVTFSGIAFTPGPPPPNQPNPPNQK